MSDDPNAPADAAAPALSGTVPKPALDKTHRLKTLEMTSKSGERSVEWLKLGATSVITTVGMWQYTSTNSFSARQPFLAKQTELCLQAAEHIAKLASTTDKEQWAKSEDEFLILWLGPLSIVEEAGTESEVAQRMVTVYLGSGGALEHAQEMAAHESLCTTKLCGRTKERSTEDEGERIRPQYRAA